VSRNRPPGSVQRRAQRYRGLTWLLGTNQISRWLVRISSSGLLVRYPVFEAEGFEGAVVYAPWVMRVADSAGETRLVAVLFLDHLIRRL
jgi:hypothetical protein